MTDFENQSLEVTGSMRTLPPKSQDKILGLVGGTTYSNFCSEIGIDRFQCSLRFV